MNEQEFLQAYDLSKYDRPSLTADVAIFAIRRFEPDSYRHEPARELALLLVRRGQHPFKDCWALPGGFVKRNETVEACAVREVGEETGVTPSALIPIGSYSQPGRDPRGWIISELFASVIRDDARLPVGSDDAAEAGWFSVRFDKNAEDCYVLSLRNGQTHISARLRILQTRFGRTELEILDSGGLAFDHAAMIAEALCALRESAGKFEVIFDFLPKRFSLTELQRVQETVMNTAVLPANFRRKIADLVVATDETTEGAGHRPALLYERKKTSQVRK